MKIKSILFVLLVGLVCVGFSFPQQISDVSAEDKEEIAQPAPVESDAEATETAADDIDVESDASNEESDVGNPSEADIVADSELENELEEMIEEEEDEDYYDDYGWSDTIMNPIRNVGQSISNSVGVAAGAVNAGVDIANDWWNADGDDYDDYFENYDDANEQVNAWWDAHIDQEYNYDEDEDDGFNGDQNYNGKDGDDDAELEDDYEDNDYDYYDLYQSMRYPKPEESQIKPKAIHHPKDNKVTLNRMRSRADIPYGVDDYFDFVVIAMCVVLLFIMMLAGISRYNNQRYLKRTYGKKNEEKRPLMD